MNIILEKIGKELPIITLEEMVVFPDTIISLTVKDDTNLKIVESIKEGDDLLVVAEKKNDDRKKEENIYKVGVFGKVKNISKDEGDTKMLFEAEERAKITKVTKEEPFLKGRFQKIEDDTHLDDLGIALKNNFLLNFNKLINMGKFFPLEVIFQLPGIREPNKLINIIIPFIDARNNEKQKVLEEVELKERFARANELILKNIKVLEIETKIKKDTEQKFSKAQRDIFLREEMKTIQKELGESEDGEYEEMARKIHAARMPEEVKKNALKELEKLKRTPVFSPEVSFIRNYLDWLIEVPWTTSGAKNIDLKEAKKILDEDHYGLEKVKERILEYLAVQNLTKSAKGPILCFVGPPGTGKTSVGKSIARALGRKFARISLGGIRDEAEIRGHRRTYVGAMPGRIIQGIRQAGSRNPVFMLDEIDKVGSDFRGDPSAALLEALDPEQNSHFSDHYLEVPFDLSDVIFITTANVLETIPPALQDRMEMIPFPGYTTYEKFHIAKNFIIPKVLKATGVEKYKINIDDKAIETIIENYTKEAGVRNLERNIAELSRKIALFNAENKKIPSKITKENLKVFLGRPKVEPWAKEIESQVGLVTGLAVTTGGGEIISIEVNFMPNGKGELILTGQLGDVMKESARIAISYARTLSEKYKTPKNLFKEYDIHVHVPQGAIPKDGPSAGSAIAAAVLSAMAKIPADKETGMTGEITLRGRILKIGGVKEKVLAAQRAGLKNVILPEANRYDMEEIPKEVQKGLKFYFIKSMDEILPLVFRD